MGHIFKMMFVKFFCLMTFLGLATSEEVSYNGEIIVQIPIEDDSKINPFLHLKLFSLRCLTYYRWRQLHSGIFSPWKTVCPGFQPRAKFREKRSGKIFESCWRLRKTHSSCWKKLFCNLNFFRVLLLWTSSRGRPISQMQKGLPRWKHVLL